MCRRAGIPVVMELGEVVLSDVHISTHYDVIDKPAKKAQCVKDGEIPEKHLAVSRFVISCKAAKVETILSCTPCNEPNPSTKDHQQRRDQISCPGEECNLHLSDGDLDVDGNGGLYFEGGELNVDEDGDLDVRRHRSESETKSDQFVITLVHHLATGLEEVGLQIWQGALLLCDYILANKHAFTGHVILDLGAGVGLTSIIAAIFAKRVFSTDVHDSILELAEHNSEINSLIFQDDLHPDRALRGQLIKVRTLDWMSNSFPHANNAGDGRSKFTWDKEDLNELKSLDTIIAADVVYDDDLTDGFFRTFHRWMSEPPAKTLYISLEKRLLFTVTDLEVVCPAYTHFCQCLEDLQLCNDNGLVYHVERLPADFTQSFQYNRIAQLEIWKITSRFNA